MLSKNKIKFIKSLQVKKYRKQEQCFVVQGAKSVQELLGSDFEILTLVGTHEFLSTVSPHPGVEVVEATPTALAAVSEFQTNDSALAIARMKSNNAPVLHANELVVMLDDIRDPGNLGTIIRTCDWYGIKSIIASAETADFYNPKVISSTMGSFTRMNMYYTDLQDYLASFNGNVYGAFLNGTDVHGSDFRNGGVILIGNESRGIDTHLEKFVTHKITIPRYGHAESLNAAIATAIILDNTKRA